MLSFYLPFKDADLKAAAASSPPAGLAGLKTRIHGTGTASLRHPSNFGTPHLLAHGRESTGAEIAGMVDGCLWGKRMVTMTAPEFAAALYDDGLPKKFADIRLMVCWGGYVGGSVSLGKCETLKRNASEAPFAGQLCGALKCRGYYRMIVTACQGQKRRVRSIDANTRTEWY